MPCRRGRRAPASRSGPPSGCKYPRPTSPGTPMTAALKHCPGPYTLPRKADRSTWRDPDVATHRGEIGLDHLLHAASPLPRREDLESRTAPREQASCRIGVEGDLRERNIPGTPRTGSRKAEGIAIDHRVPIDGQREGDTDPPIIERRVPGVEDQRVREDQRIVEHGKPRIAPDQCRPPRWSPRSPRRRRRARPELAAGLSITTTKRASRGGPPSREGNRDWR